VTVQLVATGGTISSHRTEDGWTGLDGAALLDDVRAELDADGIDVDVVDVAAGPSSNLSVDDMLAIAGRVRDALDDGVEGVVVTHGTDTVELTAFVTELLLGVDATVGRSCSRARCACTRIRYPTAPATCATRSAPPPIPTPSAVRSWSASNGNCTPPLAW
jgi:hypothetical protein